MKWFREAKHHLQVETGWGYWYHLWHSIKNSWALIKIALISLVHGLLPWVWKADAPKGVIKMYHQIMRIQHINEMDTLRKKPKHERYRDTTSNSTE
jgi:hypothetical protein